MPLPYCSLVLGSLERDPRLRQRVERLMSIPAIGPITALIWALEVGDVHRFLFDQRGHQLRSRVPGLATPNESDSQLVQKFQEGGVIFLQPEQLAALFSLSDFKRWMRESLTQKRK
jgi:hypothetical protein